ncbi:MAG TPA: amino acid ABC transporter substrate-binding protein [Ktedonobacterales bacterium]|nr:amino acid ABC transporter substrate-binding protein [Ktedonobacterales bacterium]
MGIALTALLAFSACATSSTSTGSTKPIVIGASLSTSGDFSDDGKAFQEGYQLWADQVNKNGGLLGRQVKLDIVGDNSTPDQVTTNYNKLITVDHVDFTIGPFSSLLTKPASVVTNRYGYALIEGAGGAPSVFNRGVKGLYDVSVPVEDLLVSYAQMLKAMPAGQRPSTIAYATEDDPFTQPQVDKARAQLEAAGFKTVYYQVFPAETTDYTPIATAVINKHADVFIGGTHNLDSEAFVKIFAQQHYNPKAVMFTAGPDVGAPFVQAVGANNTEGIAFANSWFPQLNNTRNTAFVQAYAAKYGVKIDEISSDAAEAFAVGEVLQQAVEQCKCTDNAKLIQALNSGKFDSVQGPVQFNSVGENANLPAYTLQWQKGNVVCVYPSPPATATLEFPKPDWGAGA